MAAPFRTEPITCHGELTLVNWCQNLVYGLLYQSVYHGRNTQKAFLAIILRDFNPADRIVTICPVLQGNYKLILISQKPWKQLFAWHLVDTATPFIADYCFIGFIQIRGTKNKFKQMFLVEWYFHDVVFGHPHESLHPLIPFGFRPISLITPLL